MRIGSLNFSIVVILLGECCFLVFVDCSNDVLSVTPSFTQRRPQIPVAVIAHNRPQELMYTLASLVKSGGFLSCDIVVFHDTVHAETTEVIQKFQEENSNIYYVQHASSGTSRSGKSTKLDTQRAISRHYHFAMHAMFDVFYPTEDHIILLEDDLLVSQDFFEYMWTGAKILRTDPTLYTVSAYNDNGFLDLVRSNSKSVHRTDFFPGLGWIATRELFLDIRDELPDSIAWDYLVRSSVVRRGRHCLYPEIPRTKHLGTTGVNADIISYSTWSDTVLWGYGHMRRAPRVPEKNFAKAEQEKYDAALIRTLHKAEVVTDLPRSLNDIVKAGSKGHPLLLVYDASKVAQFYPFAEFFGLFPQWYITEGFPRTSYKGLVQFRWHGRMVLLLDVNSPLIKETNHLSTGTHLLDENDFHFILPSGNISRDFAGTNIRIRLGESGESCSEACARGGMFCRAMQNHLEKLNRCSFLYSSTPCRKCSELGSSNSRSPLCPFLSPSGDDDSMHCTISSPRSFSCQTRATTVQRLCVCELLDPVTLAVAQHVHSKAVAPSQLVSLALQKIARGERESALVMVDALHQVPLPAGLQDRNDPTGLAQALIALGLYDDGIRYIMSHITKVKTLEELETLQDLRASALHFQERLGLAESMQTQYIEVVRAHPEWDLRQSKGFEMVVNKMAIRDSEARRHKEAHEMFAFGLSRLPDSEMLSINYAKAILQGDRVDDNLMTTLIDMAKRFPRVKMIEAVVDFSNRIASENSSYFSVMNDYSSRCLAMQPTQNICRNFLAFSNCYFKRDVEKSLALLDVGIETESEFENRATMLVTKAICQSAQKKYHGALDSLNLAEEFYTTPNVLVHIHRVKAFLKLRDYENVVRYSLKGISVDPAWRNLNKENPYHTLAVGFIGLGKVSLAVAAMNSFRDHSIEANSRHGILVNAYYELAEALARTGDVVRSVEALTIPLRIRLTAHLDSIWELLTYICRGAVGGDLGKVCKEAVASAKLKHGYEVSELSEMAIEHVKNRLRGKGTEENSDMSEWAATEEEGALVEVRSSAGVMQSGVIIYLCCGSSEEFVELKRSLSMLDANFLTDFPYPVVVFHEGFSVEEMVELQSVAPSSQLEFQHLHFHIPTFVNETNVPISVGPYGVGYRHMCRFFSVTVWSHPAVQQYDYIWRMDSDSYLYDKVGFDVIGAMKESGKLYAYMGSFRDNPLFTDGLLDFTMAYVRETYCTGEVDVVGVGGGNAACESPVLESVMDRHKDWNRKYATPMAQAGGWDHICLHTHFTIMKRSLWEVPEISAFVQAVDESGDIYYRRWGDACIHYLALSLFLDPSYLWMTPPLPYWHQQLIIAKTSTDPKDSIVTLMKDIQYSS